MGPETRYTRSSGLFVAYQVVGVGPLDVVLLSEWSTPLEARWEQPRLARPLEQLASFSRLISFDKRGLGLSDPLPISQVSTAEEWTDDLRAVLDAVGSERTALVGLGDGGPIAVLFAAAYPERTSALVLGNTMATMTADATYPWGWMTERQAEGFRVTSEDWAEGRMLDELNPSLAGDDRFRAWWSKARRHQASPGTAETVLRMLFGLDVRRVLASVQAPTLVLHRVGDSHMAVDNGRYLAAHIPGAHLVELPGTDHHWWAGDSDAIVEEIEEFLTGTRHVSDIDRVLATVLFTDIVGSTERASELGDHRWRSLLDSHDALVRQQLERHRGREVKTTGDGVLATFDGPARAIRCACALRDAARSLGLELRAGLHTGEVELRGADIGGIAVHIGHRVSAVAEPGEVLVSSTVRDLVAGSGITFSERGAHHLKGVAEEWRLYRVTG